MKDESLMKVFNVCNFTSDKCHWVELSYRWPIPANASITADLYQKPLIFLVYAIYVSAWASDLQCAMPDGESSFNVLYTFNLHIDNDKMTID